MPYLWFLTDVLRGGLASGPWVQYNLKKVETQVSAILPRPFSALTSFMVHAFVFYDIRCRLMPSRKAEQLSMPFSGTAGKDDDPGRFILVAVVARIGSDMKQPQKNVSTSCRL